LKELVFVGLGLNDEKGISVKGLEETKSADAIFMELYTSLMPDFDLERFKALCGRKVQLVSRRELEEENGKEFLRLPPVAKRFFLFRATQSLLRLT
jgi:diphthamide biosynthesis methyltransferase